MTNAKLEISSLASHERGTKVKERLVSGLQGVGDVKRHPEFILIPKNSGINYPEVSQTLSNIAQ